jgi:hypothetical protein
MTRVLSHDLRMTVQRRYSEAFRRRLCIDSILHCETVEDKLFEFSANIPVYGAHRNYPPSTTYFDDE